MPWADNKKNLVNSRRWKKRNQSKCHAYTRKYERLHRDRYLAQKAVRNAVARGKIVKPKKCSICCGTGHIQGHHEDYTKRLEVVWVCDPCHKHLHRRSV